MHNTYNFPYIENNIELWKKNSINQIKIIYGKKKIWKFLSKLSESLNENAQRIMNTRAKLLRKWIKTQSIL